MMPVKQGATQVKLCRSFKKVKRVVELAHPHFGKEAELKVLLWKAACAEGPDWLLAVDADEIFEDRMKRGSSFPGRSGSFRLGPAFRMYDFWDGMTHYREDELWQLHKRHTIALVRKIYPVTINSSIRR